MKIPCLTKTDRCINCHDHFSSPRPLIKEIVILHHFKKDCRDYKQIIKDIMDCRHVNFTELHKFEEHMEGSMIFRAKKHKIHFVYAVNSSKIIFLRAFKNFKEYKKFLDNKDEIKRIIKD